MRRAPTSLALALLLTVTLALPLAGCANGESFGRRDTGPSELDAPTSPRDAGGTDARSSRDAPALDAGASDARSVDAGRSDVGRADAGSVDAGRTDAASLDPGRDAGGGGTLDPRLDTPPASAPSCSTPGASCSAPGGPGVCRFFSATEGRCESCSGCGNLGAACSDGTDCDILFACFSGRCTNICPLGTFYCGPVEDCLDVGHPTYGVCRP